MTTTVRSVRVELEAAVAGYIRDMKLAGAETDRAFSGIEARVAGANRSVGELDKSTGGLSRTSAEARVQQSGLGREIDRTGTSAGRAERSIDKYSGRLGLTLKLAAGFGPALIPIGAIGIPAVAGIASQLGFAAAAGGSAVLALQGVGDSLKLIEKARLDPTVENLQAADEAVRRLAPDAQTLVHHLEDLASTGRGLQRTAAGGFLPGVDDALTSLEDRIPDVRRLIKEVSDAAGDEIRDAGQSIASSRWDAFFEYLRTQARPQLNGLADSVGHVAHGFAQLLVATTPLQGDFTGWLRRSTEDFDQWATRLGQDTQFQEFIAYVRENGPQVEATAAAIADAILQIVEAAAPLGGPTLQILQNVADVLGAIADSDVGTPLLTLLSLTSAYSLVAGRVKAVNETAWGGRQVANLKGFGAALTTVVTAQDRARMSAEQMVATEEKRSKAIKGGLATIGKGAALAGIFGLAASGVADKVGLANTATLGLAGSMAGPWGAAVGAGVGLLLDWSHRSDGAKAAAAEFTATLDQQTGALTENSRQKAIQQLQDAGALDAAKELGLNLSLVTDAALGNEAAQTQLNAALAGYDQIITSVGTGRGASVSGYNAEAAAVDKVSGAVDNVSGVVADSRDQFDTQASAMGGATRQTNELRAAYDRAASAADGLVAELSELDDFLNNRGTFRAYQASLDALRDSLKDAPHAFSALGEAGRTNLGNLDQIVSDAARHLETLTSPKQKANFLDGVIHTLRQIGQTSPQAADAVRDVLPALKEVRDANKDVLIKADNADLLKKSKESQLALYDLAISKTRPTITANNASAERTIDGTKGMLVGLAGTKTNPRINVDPGNSFQVLGGIRSELARIISKTITVTVNRVGDALAAGPHLAGGGTVPGQRAPYGDKVLIAAAPGEEMITNRNGEADRFRADRAAGRIPRYADGGTVRGRGRPDDGGLDDPLFTGEGPRYYKAAYRHNRPFALDGPAHWDWPYQTSLSDALAPVFEDWANNNPVYFDTRAKIVDYDMRGFWKKKRPKSWTEGQHFPDTWKTPYDTTFSHESKYATGDNPFYWHGDKLIDTRTGQVVFASSERASAGYTGRGRRDEVAGVVHRGELVIPEPDVRRDWNMLKSRYSHLPGFTDGGLAGNTYTTRYRGGTGSYAHDGGPFHAVNEPAAEPLHETAKAADGTAKALKKLETASEKVQKSYDKEKSKLDDLISQRDSLAGSIASSFLHDPFGNGLAGLDAQVSADTGDLDAMTAALATLVNNGLDPKSALYQQLAASADVNTAQQLARLSAAGLASEASRFQHRADEAGGLGLTVANQSGLQTAIGDSTKATRELRQELHRLGDRIEDLKHIRQDVRDGAKDGTKDVADHVWHAIKDGNNDRSRRVAATSATGSRPLGRGRS